MSTAILSNGTSYYIPQADLTFFTELAERMKWQIIDKMKKASTSPSTTTAKSWVDEFAGKWQDARSTAQIIQDIHKARTSNSEVSL